MSITFTSVDYECIWFAARNGLAGEIHYCSKCGVRLAEIPTGCFDTSTGQRRFFYVCPTKDCRHDGWAHGYKKRKLKDRIRENFFSSHQCVRCGHRRMGAAWREF